MTKKRKSRDDEMRCLSCFTRFSPPVGAERAACPSCQVEWRISWPWPRFAKIRGPVWDSDGRPTPETLERLGLSELVAAAR